MVRFSLGLRNHGAVVIVAVAHIRAILILQDTRRREPKRKQEAWGEERDDGTRDKISKVFISRGEALL